MIKSIYYCFLIIALGGIMSCNDPAFIDTNLVDVDLLDIETEDDFDIAALTLTQDSILVYAPSQIGISSYPFGIYNDPIFGKTTAKTIFQPFITTTSPPTFEGAIVDSVVMELIFSPTTPHYGDTTGMLGLEVYEIAETLDTADDLFSTFSIETEPEAIGSYQAVPNFSDSVEVFRLQGDSTFMDIFPAHIRIPLDNNYGERIINSGNDILTNTVEFISTFRGLELRPTIENEGLVAFNLNSFTSGKGVNYTGANVLIYYTIDGVQRQYNLAVNTTFSVRFPLYEQDYSGSIVGDFLNNEALGDSLIFVQGLAGSDALVRLVDVDKISEPGVSTAIVNGASLEIFGTALNNDEDIRPVPLQLELRSLDDEGELSFTRDFASASLVGVLSTSGGVPEDIGNGIFKYTFEIGSELQDIIEGESINNDVYIRVSNKVSTMNRVVLFGAKHSTYPIRLNVTYTKL